MSNATELEPAHQADSPSSDKRDRAGEALAALVEMFESGELPQAIKNTTIARAMNDRPSCAWSINNQLLQFLAGTDDGRGMKQWRDVGRRVTKGSRAFWILAPITRTSTTTDADTGEESKRTFCAGFKAIPVFRAEDTEGDPIDYPDHSPPELPPLADVAGRLGVSVKYLAGAGRGYYSPDRKEIGLGTHDLDTFFHELAHAAHATIEPLKGGQNPRQEIIAETTAAVLCLLYGAEGYVAESYDYVRHYAGRETDPAKAIVKLIADVGKVLDVILTDPKETA